MKRKNDANVFHWLYLSSSPARTNVELFLEDLEKLLNISISRNAS